MPDYRCAHCGWDGDWDDLIIEDEDKTKHCPDCEKLGTIYETDSVDPDDYAEQNPREIPNG